MLDRLLTAVIGSPITRLQIEAIIREGREREYSDQIITDSILNYLEDKLDDRRI